MIDRSRASRRKTARRIVAKVKATKTWLSNTVDRMTERSVKRPTKITIPHQPGKLTVAQELRMKWATRAEMEDGFVEA